MINMRWKVNLLHPQPINLRAESNALFSANVPIESQARMTIPATDFRGEGSLDQTRVLSIPEKSTIKPQITASSHDGASPRASLIPLYSIETRGDFGGPPIIQRGTSF